MQKRYQTNKVSVRYVLLCLLVMAGIVVACSSSSPTAEPPTPVAERPTPSPPPAEQSPLPTPTSDIASSPLAVPLQAPVPEAGKASVSGILYSIAGQSPIPGTFFYLTPGRGEAGKDEPTVLVGSHAEEGDISGTSDEAGRFVLNNVPPGHYYLVVWAAYNWIIATESDTDQTPRLITLEPDQQLNLETVYAPWP